MFQRTDDFETTCFERMYEYSGPLSTFWQIRTEYSYESMGFPPTRLRLTVGPTSLDPNDFFRCKIAVFFHTSCSEHPSCLKYLTGLLISEHLVLKLPFPTFPSRGAVACTRIKYNVHHSQYISCEENSSTSSIVQFSDVLPHTWNPVCSSHHYARRVS